MFGVQLRHPKLPVPNLASPPRQRSHARQRPAGHIPRPPNAFMLFRADFVRQKIIPQSVEKKHQKLSSIIGKLWKDMSEAEKAPWVCMAVGKKEEHLRKYPGYQFPSKAGLKKGAKLKKKPPIKSSARTPSTSPSMSPGGTSTSSSDCGDVLPKPNDSAIQRLIEKDFGPLESQSIFVGACDGMGTQDTPDHIDEPLDNGLDNADQQALWFDSNTSPASFPVPAAHLSTMWNDVPYFSEGWNSQYLAQPDPVSFNITAATSLPEAINEHFGQPCTADYFQSQGDSAFLTEEQNLEWFFKMLSTLPPLPSTIFDDA